jgi:hypothetical protein
VRSVVGLALPWIVAGQLIAPHLCKVGDPPSDFPAQANVLNSRSGASISGWRIRSNNRAGIIVLLHPLRGTRRSMFGRSRMSHAADDSIVMIDLRAHGDLRSP